MNILGGKYENLKLGTKLSLGFGSVLLLSLVVLIAGVIGFRSVADNNEKALATNQLNATLAQARIFRTQFQFTHDYSFIDKNGELINKMDDILRQAGALSWDKDTIDDVNRIEQDLKAYRVVRDAFIAASKSGIRPVWLSVRMKAAACWKHSIVNGSRSRACRRILRCCCTKWARTWLIFATWRMICC
ncbi:hypothetical protein PL145_23450 [Dickeya fangzhongdai]|nr:hypothetical protein PL145_23450 [Dickeya fangzhongdai]